MFQIGVFQEQRHSLRKQDCTICYWAFFCSLQYYVRQLKINITKYFCKRFYSSPLQNFHYSLFCFLSAYHLSYASKQKHLNGASAWAQWGQLKSGGFGTLLSSEHSLQRCFQPTSPLKLLMSNFSLILSSQFRQAPTLLLLLWDTLIILDLFAFSRS